jgi:hypothetical protein
MTITYTGNVGIGESNPQELLHLTDTTPVFRMEGASRTYQQYVSGTSFFIRDVTAGFNRVTLDSSGDISFYEDTGTTPKFFWDASAERLNLGDSASPRGGAFSRMMLAKTTAGDINWLEIQSSTTGRTGVVFSDGSSGNYGLVDYDHTDDHLKILTASVERLRITSSGNVGIGTTSPDYRLEVEEAGTGSGLGGIAAATATAGGNAGYRWVTGGTARFAMATIGSAGLEGLRIYDNNNASERMRIDASGNVGIGTSSPAYLVDAYGAVASRGSGTGNAAFVLQEVGNDPWYLMQFTGGAVSINYSATSSANSKFLIDTSGNVGIGTTTITSGFKLEVTGDARFGDAVGDDAVELGWSAGGSQGFIQAYDRGASAFRRLPAVTWVLVRVLLLKP